MTITLAVDFVHETCCHKGCGLMFAMTRNFYNDVRNDPKHWWHCPEGHIQHYTNEQTDAYKLQQSNARETALQDQLAAAVRDAEATRTALIRDRYRFSKGVCPCCNRSFEALRRHMESKHPDYDITKVKQASAREFKRSCGRAFETPRGLAVHQGHMRPHDWDAPTASRWSAHLTKL